MLCRQIISVIEATYPKFAALEFDNVGLLAGRSNKEVTRVYLALDATKEVIQQAKEFHADLLITHHPLIYSSLKSVTDMDFIGKRVVDLLQNDISYYAMHTNYDVLGMAELSKNIVGLTDAEVLDITAEIKGVSEGIGRIGFLPKEMTLQECVTYIKNKLELEAVKVFGDLDTIVKRLAISPGSGKGSIGPALARGAEVLVTGDIGHHDGIDAMEQGLSVIDAGHYGTEYIFIEDMKQFFAENLPGLQVGAAPIIHPFQVL